MKSSNKVKATETKPKMNPFVVEHRTSVKRFPSATELGVRVRKGPVLFRIEVPRKAATKSSRVTASHHRKFAELSDELSAIWSETASENFDAKQTRRKLKAVNEKMKALKAELFGTRQNPAA